MSRLLLKSKVGADGILHLDLPMGTNYADKDVAITVETLPSKTPMTQEEWRAWVQSMAGTWEGDFERMPQGITSNGRLCRDLPPRLQHLY